MIQCECGQKVKTKYCPQCGTEVNGDSDILKWIAECQVNLKYWRDKAKALPPIGDHTTEQKKLYAKCETKIKMWSRRIELLKQADAEKVSE